MRLELIEHGRELLEDTVMVILNVRIVSLHSALGTRTGERVILVAIGAKPAYRPV